MAGEKDDKKMVCLQKKGGQGKSETILNLAELLIPNKAKILDSNWYELESAEEIPHEDMRERIKKWSEKISKWPTDICVVTNYKEKIIGLSSEGDKAANIKKYLKKLAEKQQCDIIFCTCHSKGDTVSEVTKAARNKYKLIWTAPYTDDSKKRRSSPTPFQQFLNKKKAKDLEEFIYL